MHEILLNRKRNLVVLGQMGLVARIRRRNVGVKLVQARPNEWSKTLFDFKKRGSLCVVIVRRWTDLLCDKIRTSLHW